MGNLAQLAPLMILIPSIGAFINFFWGMQLGERASAIIGTTASALTFVVALFLLAYLGNNDFAAAVINPPLLDGWIRIESINFEISWQSRVDTLSVTMMFFISFVGTLIHLYAAGYMHGDPRFARFFAYLNMFLAFMYILILGNNFLMMFVGWEGVGLCSYLLIGFWWDKEHGEGWKNANAARKAFIVNRIGDFGVLMAVFLIFWSFGTLDFYKPGEVNNVEIVRDAGDHGWEEAEDAEGSEESTGEEESSQIVNTAFAQVEEEPGAAAEGEEGHGAGIAETIFYDDPAVDDSQLGVFNQAQRLVDRSKAGEEVMVQIGPAEFDIETLLVIITLFMLLGATGKSAQIPLFVWLPDAMAGPTPVSALIHAATMVTAGVYMMVRSNVFFYNAELTSFIVTLVGATTAIVAGFIAIGQFDIKRVLAYSTVSQLGFMVAAVGIGAYPAAMFHMITHAFFKALLFLGSGSVIHGVEHGHHEVAHHGHHDEAEVDHRDVHGYSDDTLGDHHPDSDEVVEEEFDPQDMRNMGGLRSKMPVTYYTYLIGTLALAGIWPFAGFWSKDEILADAWLVGFVDGELGGYIALGLLLIAAAFTAFYMWRQIEMVFHGEPRTEAAEHAHESGPSMTLPLIILAVSSVLVGFLNLPTGAGIAGLGLGNVFGKHAMADFLEYSIANFHLPPFQPILALGALGLAIGAIFFARSIYGDNKAVDERGRDPLGAAPGSAPVWSLSNARMYWDETYYRFIEGPYNRIGKFLADTIDWNFLHDYFHDRIITRGFNGIGKVLSSPIDLGVIDGAVNGIGWVVRRLSGSLRQVQTGYVRTYAVFLFVGVVIVIVIMLLPLIQIG